MPCMSRTPLRFLAGLVGRFMSQQNACEAALWAAVRDYGVQGVRTGCAGKVSTSQGWKCRFDSAGPRDTLAPWATAQYMLQGLQDG